MGLKQKKQYLQINNAPIISHTLSKFLQYEKPNEIILVVPENDIEYCKTNILQPLKAVKKVLLIPGGEERQGSVLNGINAIKTLSNNYDQDIVLIHDGVRPFLDCALINACINGAIKYGACVPALKATDTMKIVHNKIVSKTIDRDSIYQIQTPQAFLLKIIINAIEYAENKKFYGTDDASIVEFYGHKVAVIKGLKRNIKITTKEDLKFAKAYLTL
ncbi:MAG: 2-C-methyl-D-erythritol 4-phosphate cytidylyltransferase [Desulfobacteraceae bacterium]|nr:2-C-methyl-D-erythritol 4-phosphate cytidylyltransferase [Desulfobacteraceae bacterium]